MKGWLASLGRHKALKVLAFFLAVALWFAVGGEERTETTLNLPLEIINRNPDLMLVNEIPLALQVRVSGPRSTIRNLSQARQSHTIDLAGVKAGRHTISVGPSAFSFPRGVTVTRVQPNSLTLTLVATVTRTLAIQPVVIGSPPNGFALQSVKMRPETITVKGPAAELEGLKTLSTLPIDVSSLTAPVTLPTDLDLKNLHLTREDPAPILADLVVAEKTGTRTFAGLPISAAPQPARLNPAQATLTLEGPWRRLKDLKPSDLTVTANTVNLKPGRHRLKVNVDLPNGFRLLKASPDTVTAQVLKSP